MDANHVATTPTACGIETVDCCESGMGSLLLGCNNTYRLRYWNSHPILCQLELLWLQQYLSFTVYAEGCETAEEQSDDEVRTSQVPERSEGKTKVIKQQHLPPAVLKRTNNL